MKILNLYCGVGGNRLLWENVDVTAVEYDAKISALYKKLHPKDNVITGDAHEFLINHMHEYDFIWSSPPCQSHSKMAKATRHKKLRYPDMRLYEEILLLKHFYNGLWVVENVNPYYGVLIPAQKVGRHVFWSNFSINSMDVKRPKGFIGMCNMSGKKSLQEWLGVHFEENIYYGNNHCPAQILRNCVHPKIGLDVLNSAKKTLIYVLQQKPHTPSPAGSQCSGSPSPDP